MQVYSKIHVNDNRFKGITSEYSNYDFFYNFNLSLLL